MTPFRIDVPPADLDDLKDRLKPYSLAGPPDLVLSRADSCTVAAKRPGAEVVIADALELNEFTRHHHH